MAGYTSYIQPLAEYEEVKLIKDIRKPDKVSVRNVDSVITECMTPTMILRKGSKKEKIQFNAVSEFRSSQGLDIIELRSDNGRSAFIRIKSRDSLERWVEYLKTFLPQPDNEYEVPDAPRARSSTNTVHNRRNPRKTPRTPEGVQSVVEMTTTTFGHPVSTHHVLDSLPEDEAGYDIVNYVNYPPPPGDITDETYSSLRSTDTNTNDYYEEPEVGVESQTVVNVNVIHGRRKKDGPPIPPKRGPSMKFQEDARVGHANAKDNSHISELIGAVHNRNISKPQPPLRTNRPRPIRQTDSEIEEAECDDEEDAKGGIYVTGRISGERIREPGLTTFKPDLIGRNHTIRRGNADSNKEADIVKDSSPPSSSCSSDDENEPTPPNQASPTEIYEDNARLAMKYEMEDPHGITCHAELGQLQNLGIVDTQYGACINDVPANLQRKFYHGDKIISINEQRIKDAFFARSIIETSENQMVKVTVLRLFKGHYIKLERESIGGTDSLGFALHNGPEIMYISPGTMFAKQATSEMMADKPCITHIEKKFIPPSTSTKEVNVALRNAGHKFHIIIQPVEFIKELMQQS